jgi:hypothetical protein
VKNVKNAFIEMTRRALGEEDVRELIELLMKREAIRQKLVKDGTEGLTSEEARECLEYEELVGERLQKEFTKLMGNMEELSRKTKAIRRYEPKFPFPSMPAFVEHDA